MNEYDEAERWWEREFLAEQREREAYEAAPKLGDEPVPASCSCSPGVVSAECPWHD
jgi:hypothetical protein